MANANLSPDRLIIEHFIRAVTQNWLNVGENEHHFEVRCLGEHRTPILGRLLGYRLVMQQLLLSR